jgi:transposase-like protein
VINEPEFCPNPICCYHRREIAKCYLWYRRFGTFSTKCRGEIQRFRCTACGKTCSTQTFSVHYWTHSTDNLAWLLGHLYGCSGLRQTGRFAGVTYRVVANRTRRLARNALTVMDLAMSRLTPEEDLALDGFESYTRSQYHPNNITHVVGKSSEFIYAAVHTLLRRKGSMTAQQKRHRALIDLVWRPTTTVRQDVGGMLGDLAPAIERSCATREQLTLSTDEHRSYPPAIKDVRSLGSLLSDGRLVHERTSSREARTTKNPLFVVNYVDRQMRKNMAEHVRETIRQGREVNCQMERMAVFMMMHNFLTPKRITDQARFGEQTTHAEAAGISGEEMCVQLRRLFTHRHVWTHLRSGQGWITRIWQHLYENPPVVRLKKGRLLVRSVALAPRMLPAHLLA